MQKLKFGTVNYSDACELQRNDFGNLEPVSGIECEVLKITSQILKLDIDILMPEDDTWGLKINNNKWSGILGMLQRKEVDFAIASLAISADRMEIADFSFPYSFDRITFATLNPALKSKEFVYLHPFQCSVWIGYFLSILAFFIFTLCIIRRHNTTDGKWLRSASVAADIVFCMKGYKCLPTSPFYRTFFGMFNLSKFILSLSYTCIFLSFVLAPLTENKIESFPDLIEASRNGKLKIAVPKDMGQWILSSKDNLTKALSTELLRQGNDAFLSRNKEHVVSHINDGYAIISASSILHFKLYHSGEIRRAYVASGTLRPKFDAIAFRKDFCCIKQFNQVVIKILQAGLYEKISRDYLYRWLSQAKQPKDNPKLRKITLQDIVGAFYIMFPFYSLSMLSYFMEIYCWKRIKQRRKIFLRNKRKRKRRNYNNFQMKRKNTCVVIRHL